MGELHTAQYKETLQSDAPRELYREKIGFQDYVITDEKPEVIEKWKIEIEQLRDAISRRDLESLVGPEESRRIVSKRSGV